MGKKWLVLSKNLLRSDAENFARSFERIRIGIISTGRFSNREGVKESRFAVVREIVSADESRLGLIVDGAKVRIQKLAAK